MGTRVRVALGAGVGVLVGAAAGWLEDGCVDVDEDEVSPKSSSATEGADAITIGVDLETGLTINFSPPCY